MQKIIAIAAQHQHLLNFCNQKKININKFIHATDPKKLRGLRDFNYIVVSEPYSHDLWEKMQYEFRVSHANRLPLDINQWSLMEFA